MIAALLLAAVAGLEPPHTAVLPCGRGSFTAVTRRWANPGPLAPAEQSLLVDSGERPRVVPLEPTRLIKVEGRRVRNRYLLSWACITSRNGTSYVMLGYACAVDRGYRNDCGGEPEWFRWLDDRGRAVDAGVPVNGAARDRLSARLGLSDVLEAGVHMTSLYE